MANKSENIYTEEFFSSKKDEFLSATENVKQVQWNLLKEILSKNSQTQYGKLYGFEQISSVKEFQEKVSITKYDNYSEFIEKISDGEKNVLTNEDVKILEPSSGSTSACKLVPYTESLKKEFNKGIEPWLSDLYLNIPEIINTPAYWSISPGMQTEKYTRSGMKIGFDNDAEYLSDEFSYLLQKSLFIPEFISEIQDIEVFKYVILLYLLAEENLAFISIWNPSLFLILLDKLKKQREIIIKDIENNTLPDQIEKTLKDKILSSLNFKEKRKTELLEILSQDEIQYSSLWKNLKLISCWADANAKPYAKKLQKIFPNTHVQPKGLLATEGIISIPIENIGKLPCVNSHFFEFIEQNTQNPTIKLLNELSIGKEYSIILTTSGGLYRYEIGDIVRVYDKYGDCPCLEFIGKKDNISDYFGEKLNETHIKSIIDKFKIPDLSTFYLFAPVKDRNNFFYTLYIEPKKHIKTDKLKSLNESLEKELLKNFHYKYCRELSQLQHFKLFLIDKSISATNHYLEICTQKGLKLGDIKPIFFSNRYDWHFKGDFVK